MLSRLLTWRVGVRWYAVALLTYPLTMAAILGTLALISPQVLPGTFVGGDGVALLLSGMVAGLAAGFFEELGWTGFATPRLRLRYGVVLTGLIVGLLWGAWHLPLFASSASSATAVAPVLMLAILLFSFLPPFRVLMVWVYERTQSLLLVILMHASLTGSTVALALVAPGLPAVTYDLVLGIVLWIGVAAVAVANHGHIAVGAAGAAGDLKGVARAWFTKRPAFDPVLHVLPPSVSAILPAQATPQALPQSKEPGVFAGRAISETARCKISVKKGDDLCSPNSSSEGMSSAWWRPSTRGIGVRWTR